MSSPQGTRQATLGRHAGFSFTTGNLVLVKWNDGMVYFAKVKRIDRKREKCTVVFDDKSQDEADFCQIHSVDETTTDIICIKCKKDNSDSPNEIVLCDMCGIGFHQKCHAPPIPASALQLDSPWKCSYCQRGTKCPFITESLDVLQNLLSDDNETTTGDEEEGPVESEYTESGKEESSPIRCREKKKRKYRKHQYSRSAMYERRKSLRLHTHSPEVSGLVTSERKGHSLAHETGEGEENSSPPKARPHTLANSSLSGSEVTDSSSSRKRKRHHTAVLKKKLKRSSVESRTVSVTRIDTPIYEQGSVNFLSAENGSAELSPVFSPTDSEPAVTDKSCVDEGSSSAMDISGGSQSESPTKEKPAKVKQREFRVSLTLPDEVQKRPQVKPGIKNPLSYSKKSTVSSSSPRSHKRSPSFESDSCFTSPNSAQNSTVPFLASPLPTISKKQLSKKQLEIDGTKETKPPTRGKHVREHPRVLKVSVSSPVPVNAAVSKTLESSHHQSMSNSHSAKMGTNVGTRLIDVGVKSSPNQPLMDVGESSTEVMSSSPRGSSAVVAVVTASSAISPSNSMDGGVTGSDNPAFMDPVAPEVIASSEPVAPEVITSSEPAAPEVIASSEPATPEVISSSEVTGSLVVLASSDSMMDIGDSLTGIEQPYSCTIQGTDPVAIASLNFDVGVHGRTDPSSQPSTNLMAISTIDIEGMDSTADAATADNDCPSKTEHDGPTPCCSPPPPVSAHRDAITVQLPLQSLPATTPSAITAQASLSLTRSAETPEEEPSGNSASVCSAVKQAALTSHENNAELCTESTNSPPEVVPTKTLMHRPAAGRKVPSSKAEFCEQEMCHLSKHNLSSNCVHAEKPQGATGAPTAVITKTPQQLRGHLPEVQIVKADTANQAREQLPPAAGDKSKVLANIGDPDVIITGVEPSVGDSGDSQATEPSQTNKGSQQNYEEAKKVFQLQSPTVQSSNGLPRSEKPAYYYKVKTKAHSQPETSHGSHVENRPHPVESETNPVLPRILPNTMRVLYSAEPPPRQVLHHRAEVSVAAKSTVHQGTGTHLYYTTPVHSDSAQRVGKSSHHPGTVITTKPYAFVNAIPAQPSDVGYRSIALSQKPLAGGGGGHIGHHMMQVVSTAGQAVQQLVPENPSQQSGYIMIPATSSSPGSSSHPPPPSYSTYIAGKKTNKEKVSEEDVQSIQKKIGDAFTQSSEVMLVSAFEEAWKKFQDNGNVYKEEPTSSHQATIDMEVVAGTSNQLSLVSSEPRVVAPKPLPENVRMIPATSQGHHHRQYIQFATAPPTQQQQQLLVQQIPSDYNIYTIPAAAAAGENQVRVAGLYYPNVDQSDSHKVVMAAKKVPSATKSQSSLLQRVVLQERPRLVGQGPSSRPQQVTHAGQLATKGTHPGQLATKGTHPGQRTSTGTAGTVKHVSKKKCAWCGGGAIYLCSGCHREWYCGSECQLKSWECHSDHCKA